MTEKLFKQISIGKDGSAWAIGKEDSRVYRLVNAGTRALIWIPNKAGKATALAAVDKGSAWCVNEEGQIWQLTDWEYVTSEGRWTNVPTKSGRNDAKSIAVATDGTVWYTQTDGVIYRTSTAADGANQPFWIAGQEGGKGVSVAPIDKDFAYCVNNKGELWQLSNGSWRQFPTYQNRTDAQSVTTGRVGVPVYVDRSGSIFVYPAGSPGGGVQPEWWRVDLGDVGSVTSVFGQDSDEIWCVNAVGQVWIYKRGSWQHRTEIAPNDNVWTYTIQPRDQLNAIVKRAFNLTQADEINAFVDDIVLQNGIVDRNQIEVGQQLIWLH